MSKGWYVLLTVSLGACVGDLADLPADDLDTGSEVSTGVTDEVSGEEPDGELTGDVEQALGATRTRATDTRAFGGSIGGDDHFYVIGGLCSPGYVRVDRPGDPSTQWTSQAGGHCNFHNWATPSNPYDCTAIIHARTGGGFFGGTCLSVVREVFEGPKNFAYSAANTDSAKVNTVNQEVVLGAGQTIVIGTVGVPGASFSGDSYLVLAFPNAPPFFGQTAAFNDDALGTLGSRIVFTAPISGTYMIRAGCYGKSACSGTVAWQ